MSVPQGQRGASNVDNRNTGGVRPEAIQERADKNCSSSEELSLDDIFGLLSNSRRREVLQYLTQKEGDTVTMDELARHVAAKENDIDMTQISSKQRKRAYVALHQNHLRMLDKHDVIEHDKNRGTVVSRDMSQISPYLSIQADVDQSYNSLYVAGVIGVLVTVGLLGIGPASAVPTAAWALLSTTALLVIALGQTLTDSVNRVTD